MRFERLLDVARDSNIKKTRNKARAVQDEPSLLIPNQLPLPWSDQPVSQPYHPVPKSKPWFNMRGSAHLSHPPRIRRLKRGSSVTTGEGRFESQKISVGRRTNSARSGNTLGSSGTLSMTHFRLSRLHDGVVGSASRRGLEHADWPARAQLGICLPCFWSGVVESRVQ